MNLERQIVTINVGGKIFQISGANFKKIPMLVFENGFLNKDAASSHQTRDEWFFDRDPSLFGYILNFYRFDELHMPRNVCGTVVKRELEFWGIPESRIGSCCWRTYVNMTEEVVLRARVETELEGKGELVFTTPPVTSLQTIRQKIWRIMYESNSSRIAKAWAVMVYVFILASVVSSFLEQSKEHQEWRTILLKCGYNNNTIISRVKMPFIRYVEEMYYELVDSNFTWFNNYDFCKTGLSDEDLMRPLREIEFIVSRPNNVLVALDTSCLAFFTVEFIVRFIVCPNRIAFLKCLITVIDLIYLVSRWGFLITHVMVPVILDYDVSFIIFRIFQIFSCFRVLRIFQLARNIKGLKYFLLTLKASIPIMGLLLFVIFILATVLVDMMRKVESLEHDNFLNILVAYWWAVVTMSTVGYGDFYPTTSFGYLIGGLCVLLGPIIIGFFVPIISSNFLLYYGYKERPIVTLDTDAPIEEEQTEERKEQTHKETTTNSKQVYI